MALQKTEAFVLKSQNLGETSKIITLYSRKYGKIKVVAKGARGLKSHFYGSLETLNHIALVYYHKENRDLQLLSQADIMDSYKGIRGQLHKFGLASMVNEIIIRSEIAEHANPKLFGLMLEFMKNLDDSLGNFENYFFWFQLKFLETTGVKPQLRECLSCGQGQVSSRLLFSIPRGGYICEQCLKDDVSGIFISVDVVKYMLSLSHSAPDDLQKLTCTAQTWKECSEVLNKFMQYHIPGLGYLKSSGFLKHVRNSNDCT